MDHYEAMLPCFKVAFYTVVDAVAMLNIESTITSSSSSSSYTSPTLMTGLCAPLGGTLDMGMSRNDSL